MTDLRAEVAAHIPEGAFLRRDRGSALYVTNARPSAISGFSVVRDGALTKISPDMSTMRRYDAAPDRLARELARFGGGSAKVLKLFTECVKCAEAPERSAFEKCDRAVRGAAAVAMRRGGGEGLYYCALALAEAARKLNEAEGK